MSNPYETTDLFCTGGGSPPSTEEELDAFCTSGSSPTSPSFLDAVLLQPITARYTPLQGQMPYLRKPLLEIIDQEPEPTVCILTHLQLEDLSPRPTGTQFCTRIGKPFVREDSTSVSAGATFNPTPYYPYSHNLLEPSGVEIKQNYPSGYEDTVHPSLRQWATSQTPARNHLCDHRLRRQDILKRTVSHINAEGNGSVLPGVQSAALWQRMGLHAVSKSGGAELELRFTHAEDNAPLAGVLPEFFDAPSVPSEVARATVDKSADRVRDDVSKYDKYPDTVRERAELLLLPTQKAQREKAVEDSGKRYMIGTLEKPDSELLAYWNQRLLKASKSEKTPLAEEIDFYPQEGNFGENKSDGREHSPSDEWQDSRDMRINGVSLDGTRETQGDRPNDHQGRSEWQKLWQARFNPFNKKCKDVTPEDIRQVTEDPDFPCELARMQAMFGNVPIEELAAKLGITPNNLVKNLSRSRDLPGYWEQMLDGIDVSKAGGRFGIRIHLNGRNELKILGASDDPPSKLLLALEKEQAKSKKGALKLVRRRARQEKWSATRRGEEEGAAINRINEAYAKEIELLKSLKGVAMSHFP